MSRGWTSASADPHDTNEIDHADKNIDNNNKLVKQINR